MALVEQYKAFKLRLGGYAEVPFDEFRGKILPLRRKRSAWSEDEVGYVEGLVNAGAGHALQALFGARHPAAARVLGEGALEPEPLTKAQLEDCMRTLTGNFLAAGWAPRRFAAFAAYLDSDMTPAQLDEQNREARRLRAMEQPLYGQAQQARAEAPAPPGEPAPDRDLFAEMYRRAGPAFKRVVNERLALAAARAREPAPAR